MHRYLHQKTGTFRPDPLSVFQLHWMSALQRVLRCSDNGSEGSQVGTLTASGAITTSECQDLVTGGTPYATCTTVQMEPAKTQGS